MLAMVRLRLITNTTENVNNKNIITIEINKY